MEKNYSSAKALTSKNNQLRDIVIQRIMAFSKSYSSQNNDNKAFDLLKN
jgi:hypothetical protein